MVSKPRVLITVLLLCICVINGIKCNERVKRIVGGNPASPPPPPGSINFVDDGFENVPSSTTTSTTPEPEFDDNNDAIVFPKRGRRRAQVNGVKEKEGYYSFRGIKYAQAPEGRLRFQRPVRYPLNGKVSATKFGPPCPQPLPNNRGVVGQEDCLFLNVFTPTLPTRREKKSSGLPVIFWIHGGGFRRGSGSQYGVKDLVKKGVVVVTIQYRLGTLGFLSRKNRDIPGNVGLFDISAALRWVKEYIRFFGGNPKRVISSGQGTGASAACMVAMNKFSSDSVRGVFAMSGSAVSSFAVDEKEVKTSNEVGELNSCRDEDGVKYMRCMQAIPFDKIIEADSQLQENRVQESGAVKSMGVPLNPSPSVEGQNDGRFLPFYINLPPIDALKGGQFMKVPLLTGVTREETSTAVQGGLFDSITKKLGETTDFLQGHVFKELLTANTGLYSNGSVNPSLNTLFNSQDYLTAVTSSLSAAGSQIQKMIEVTTDALFNLPAFLTSQLWSKQSNAYLYQFDYESSKAYGKQFLGGLSLVDTDDAKPHKGVGHGDDLIYLFDPCTLDGEPINDAQLSAEKDKKVREHFTTMVAEFARSGKPQIKEAGISGWNPFKDDSSDYLLLSDKPKVKSGFRKCQMALWAGIGETLKSAECSALNAGELVNQLTGSLSSGLLDQTSLKNLGSSLTEPVSSLTNGLDGAAKDTTALLTNPIGGLLGGGGNNDKNKNNQKKPSGMSNPLGSIFG